MATPGKAEGVDSRKALIVANDPMLQQYVLNCVRARGCRTVLVPSVADALEQLAHERFCFTVVDLDEEPAGTGHLAAHLKLQSGDPGTVIGLTSADPRAGALLEGIDHVIGKSALSNLQRTIRALLNGTPPATSAAGEAVVVSPPREMALWTSRRMQDIRAIIEEAAAVDVTVLITGETGTGKDVVARAIHSLSSRRSGPFVKVNCAAVPRELLESELFGHERGAFTGAHKLKIGKFEAAHNGTIFLDEIGDLHPALQAKLLHVLQDGDFSRVGGKSSVKVDVRVLAATNQDLERGVAEGRFREDLFYRLNVIEIVVPPLRERMDEIPGFVDYFVHLYARMFHREAFAVAPAVMERLLRHRYPGNVRELENLIKRMIVLSDPLLVRGAGRSLGVAAPTSSHPSAIPDVSLKEAVRKASIAAERDIIARVLEATGGNRTRAARALRISYRGLLYKIKRVGLARVRPSFSPAAAHGPEPSVTEAVP